MISYEQAKKSFGGRPPTEVGEMLAPALRGDVVLPLSGGRNEEPPEDFFGQLLASDETAEEVRTAIIDACRNLFVESLDELRAASTTTQELLSVGQTAFVRLCRLINIAKPEELQDWAVTLLQVQLRVPRQRPEILGACVRAALAYPQAGKAAGVWDSLLVRKNLAAYGFQALLALHSSRGRIVRELLRFWSNRLMHGWPTDAALLTLQASRQKEYGDSLIVETLLSLRLCYPALWDGVKTELLRRPSTAKWLDWIRPAQPAKITFGRKRSILQADLLVEELGRPTSVFRGKTHHANYEWFMEDSLENKPDDTVDPWVGIRSVSHHHAERTGVYDLVVGGDSTGQVTPNLPRQAHALQIGRKSFREVFLSYGIPKYFEMPDVAEIKEEIQRCSMIVFDVATKIISTAGVSYYDRFNQIKVEAFWLSHSHDPVDHVNVPKLLRDVMRPTR